MSASRAVIDHVFICTDHGAPAADLLVRAGLIEGPPNRHPGQGTANRRFFFSNSMLELLFVEDEAESSGSPLRRSGFAERLKRGPHISPFGVILGPARDSDPVCPFPSWTYRPETIPGLELRIALDTSLAEPFWCWTPRVPDPRDPVGHPAGLNAVTGIAIECARSHSDSGIR